MLALGAISVCTPARADQTFAPDPIAPADNPSNPAKIALGARLFSEQALAINQSISCAGCHDPQQHFTDGRKVAIGATGEQHTRNTPTLYNVAYNSSFGWEDLGLTALEAQHLVPLFNTDPVEMGYSEAIARPRLLQPDYHSAFAQAFTPAEREQLPLTSLVTRSLATYVRTLTHPRSAFDDFVYNDINDALSAQAKAGLDLFISPRLGCSGCHANFTFSGPIKHVIHQAPPEFHHTAVDGSTLKFRAPTLRAIRHTAPYMHAGNLSTLDDVITHYETTDAESVPDFSLSLAERSQLLSFLESL